MSDEHAITGSFATLKTTRPAVAVDCSDWVDTSAGDWTFGSFESRKTIRPAVESPLIAPEPATVEAEQQLFPIEPRIESVRSPLSTI